MSGKKDPRIAMKCQDNAEPIPYESKIPKETNGMVRPWSHDRCWG